MPGPQATGQPNATNATVAAATRPVSDSTKRKGVMESALEAKRARIQSSTVPNDVLGLGSQVEPVSPEFYDTESGTVCCEHEQLIDIDTLWRYMHSLEDKPKLKEKKQTIKRLLNVCETKSATYDKVGKPMLIGRAKVQYMHQIVESRIYPARSNWYHDIFSQDKKARAAAGGRIYVDLDIENCFPVLLEFLCNKHRIAARELKEYNVNRDKYIQEVIEHYQPKRPQEEEEGAWTPRKAVKALSSAGYNGAGNDFISKWRQQHSVGTSIEEHSFVASFFKQNSSIANKLITEHYPDVLAEVKAKMPHKPRPVQSALHCVLARMETQCREVMKEMAAKHGVRMDSPQHDGAYFRLDTPMQGRDWYGRHAEKMEAFDWLQLCVEMSAAIKAKYCYPVKASPKDIEMPTYLPTSTSVFRQSDFVPNLPLSLQMEWMNRHCVGLTGRPTDGVAKITYAPDSDAIQTYAVQGISSFKSTFAGMMVEIPVGQQQLQGAQAEGGGCDGVTRMDVDRVEEHDNTRFADWLSTEGMDRFAEECPRSQTASMHKIAQRVRDERGFLIASQQEFARIEGVKQAHLSIGTEYFKELEEEEEGEHESGEEREELEEEDDDEDGHEVEEECEELEEEEQQQQHQDDDCRVGSESAATKADTPAKTELIDLAYYWCRSMEKRTAQDIVFEPHPVGKASAENSDYLNLFSGLPHDHCLKQGSTLKASTAPSTSTARGSDHEILNPVCRGSKYHFRNPYGEGDIAAAGIIPLIERGGHQYAVLQLEQNGQGHRIAGFGGKVEAMDRHWTATAMRELVEESGGLLAMGSCPDEFKPLLEHMDQHLCTLEADNCAYIARSKFQYAFYPVPHGHASVWGTLPSLYQNKFNGTTSQGRLASELQILKIGDALQAYSVRKELEAALKQYKQYEQCVTKASTKQQVAQGQEPPTFSNATIDPKEAAFIALQQPDAKFKQPIPEGAVAILRHIEKELCNNDMDSSVYLLRSLAYGYRNRTKTGVLNIILGEKGIGKSTIFGSSPQGVPGLMHQLYGKHFKEVSAISELMETFSDKQELESMFVTIEEAADMHCNGHQAKQAMDTKLRHMLTSGTKSHQLKHQTKDSGMKDYRNFVALVNPDRRDAFTIQQGDRRLAMFEASNRYSKLAEDEGRITAGDRKAYFSTLWQAVQDEATLQWIARYLVYDVDLKDWSPEDIPQTRLRSEQQELTICPVKRFLEVWSSGGSPLYFDTKVEKKDAEGKGTSSYEEHTRKLEAVTTMSLGASMYSGDELFSAFNAMCKTDCRSKGGIKNSNAFTQQLTHRLANVKGKAQNTSDSFPGFHKERHNNRNVYYMIKTARD